MLNQTAGYITSTDTTLVSKQPQGSFSNYFLYPDFLWGTSRSTTQII